MQVLSSDGHEFAVDGVKYLLPPLSIEDVLEVQRFEALKDGALQAEAMSQLMQRRAVSRRPWWRVWSKSSAMAVAGLGIRQQSLLFTEWAASSGISSGESSSSGN